MLPKLRQSWREWRSLWHITKTVKVPAFDITVMTPYLFLRVMWYTTSIEFKAWPATLDSGMVLGWRWPFRKKFRERAWAWNKTALPLAIFGGPMDAIYLTRAANALYFNPEDATTENMRWIGPTVKDAISMPGSCTHAYWIENCSSCACRAMLLAITMKKQLAGPVKTIAEQERERFDRQGAERHEANMKSIEAFARRKLEASRGES